MTIAEYIVKCLEDNGITHCFSVVGGGSMYLNDAFGKSKKIKTIYCHHEQACAMAAVAYSKLTGKTSVVCVTTGCGATNTITGLLDAWQDYVSVLFISGQVNEKDCYRHYEGLRGNGIQEADILSIVKPIVKYYGTLQKFDKENRVVEGLLDIVQANPSGPVWLECPLDVQGAEI
ncbi:MAG: hypothetical protein HGB12_02945 [Bacteroidetes bacterium]|nr:hypothetical protein [Bacteroidota bacterium]